MSILKPKLLHCWSSSCYDLGITMKTFVNRGHEPLNIHDIPSLGGLSGLVGL